MSFDGYIQIFFSTIVPSIIAIFLEVKFGKNVNKKKYVIGTIGIWILVTIVLTVIYFLTKSDSYNEIESKPIIENQTSDTGNQSPIFTGDGDNQVIYNNYYSETYPEPSTPSESATSSEPEEMDQKNFGQAMQHIYSNEEDIQKEIINNEKNKPINSSIYPGVSYWYVSDKVRLIVVTNGFRDNECTRTYYFDENGNLTFALVKDNIGEHRLYFYDDILIRYIDENGQNYDVDVNLNDGECEWINLALEESNEIFNGVKKPSNQEDLSVVTSYNMNTPQTAIDGVNVLIQAETSFPADHVTISGISDDFELEPTAMHGGVYKWQFVATFYIKGTYTVTITAYNSDGESVSDEFTFVY